MRIPLFVVPFLAVWWGLDSLLKLPDLAVIIFLYLMVTAAFAGWGRWVHGQQHPYRALGLGWNRAFRRELRFGIVIATLGGFAPLIAEAAMGWLVWQPVSLATLMLAVANAIATAVAIGLAEELLFRGWLLEELRMDYSKWFSAALTTAIFTSVHQWGPQLVGLVIVGVILVRAKYRTGDRLGLSIGLHIGWVLAISVVNIADWVSYTSKVPAWITGIGGNPLAGLVGWITLLATLVGIEQSGPRDQAEFTCSE